MIRSKQPKRVVKVGGSLLSWLHVTDAFHQWLDEQSKMATLVVVGGGQSVDFLRMDRQLNDHDAHWGAIECMSRNARQFAADANVPVWNAGIAEYRSYLECSGHNRAGSCFVVDSIRQCVEQLNGWPSLNPLPESWGVTSDSIAAQIGRAIECSELVLLKSCKLPKGSDDALSNLAACGIVDGHFPAVAADLLVRIVELRSYRRGLQPDVVASEPTD